MGLVFERDIPELRNKRWKERRVLYQEAADRDKRIRVRSIMANLMFVPVFCALMELLKHKYLPSFLWVGVLYLAIGIPLAFLVRAWWVNPLIKNAIQLSPVPDAGEVE